jgi:hypothetical protein
LLLLVHGLERFVVTQMVREIPYSIAHVQLLPDLEEMSMSAEAAPPMEVEREDTDTTPSAHAASSLSVVENLISASVSVSHEGSVNDNTSSLAVEADAMPLRYRALQTSFDRWHSYEYAHVNLPVKKGDLISITDIVGTELAKVMPLVGLSSCGSTIDLARQGDTLVSSPANDNQSNKAKQASIEMRLLRSQQYILPSSVAELQALYMPSLHVLEEQLWFAMDDFVKFQTKHNQKNDKSRQKFVVIIPIPPELLSLLPRQRPSLSSRGNDVDVDDGVEDWPDTFSLNEFATFWEKIIQDTEKEDKLKAATWTKLKQDTQANLAKKTSSSSADDDADAGVVTFTRVSDEYPAHRRQRRLSYAAPVLIESRMTQDGLRFDGYRQHLLEIPSTQMRLWKILQDFRRVNQQVTGAFQ